MNRPIYKILARFILILLISVFVIWALGLLPERQASNYYYVPGIRAPDSVLQADTIRIVVYPDIENTISSVHSKSVSF